MANIPVRRVDVVGQVRSFDDIVGVFAADFDPSIEGFAGEEGSLLLRTNGQSYRKIGAGDNDWNLQGGALSVTLSDGTPCQVQQVSGRIPLTLGDGTSCFLELTL